MNPLINSVYIVTGPSQFVEMYSDGACNHSLGSLATLDEASHDGTVGSLLFYVPGVCSIADILKELGTELTNAEGIIELLAG